MRNRGFTLIELLVVLVIMGLMMALAPAAFERVLPGLAHKSAARDVAASLRQARGRAIRGNREVAVIVDVDRRTLSTDGGAPKRLDDDLAVSLVTGRSELLADGTGRIRFFPDGTSTGGRITLAGNGREYHVLIDWLTGGVTIRD